MWRDDDVLKVPTGSLFRHRDGWAVFVIDGEVARLRRVQLGQRNQSEAQILEGLSPGEVVVMHPPDTLVDGSRVSVRAG